MLIVFIILLFSTLRLLPAQHEKNAYLYLNSYAQLYAISEGQGKAWYPYLKFAIDEFLSSAREYKKEKNCDKVKEIISIIENHRSNLDQEDIQMVNDFL